MVGEHERVDLPEGFVIEELKTEEITEENNMGDDHKTMAEYTRPTLNGTSSCIVRPAIEANNFDVKASTMTASLKRIPMPTSKCSLTSVLLSSRTGSLMRH